MRRTYLDRLPKDLLATIVQRALNAKYPNHFSQVAALLNARGALGVAAATACSQLTCVHNAKLSSVYGGLLLGTHAHAHSHAQDATNVLVEKQQAQFEYLAKLAGRHLHRLVFDNVPAVSFQEIAKLCPNLTNVVVRLALNPDSGRTTATATHHHFQPHFHPHNPQHLHHIPVHVFQQAHAHLHQQWAAIAGAIAVAGGAPAAPAAVGVGAAPGPGASHQNSLNLHPTWVPQLHKLLRDTRPLENLHIHTYAVTDELVAVIALHIPNIKCFTLIISSKDPTPTTAASAGTSAATTTSSGTAPAAATGTAPEASGTAPFPTSFHDPDACTLEPIWIAGLAKGSILAEVNITYTYASSRRPLALDLLKSSNVSLTTNFA